MATKGAEGATGGWSSLFEKTGDGGELQEKSVVRKEARARIERQEDTGELFEYCLEAVGIMLSYILCQPQARKILMMAQKLTRVESRKNLVLHSRHRTITSPEPTFLTSVEEKEKDL